MQAAEILEKMQGKTALVVGDWITDIYHFGRVERICPEAPVPVFIEELNESREGGAANVFRQVAALGVGCISGLSPSYSVKQRWIVGQHMLLRQDNDRSCVPLEVDILRTIRKVAQVDVVVLSDYAKGWLSFDMCQAVIREAIYHKIPVIADPKGSDWAKFVGCDLICPSTSDGFDKAPFLHPIPNVLWKRGAKGMVLDTPEGEHHIPAVARHVYDVTGAGDTVVAVVAAAVAAGASFLEAAQIAALAAGYVVGEVGTTVCSKEKLKELIDAQAHA